MPKCVSSKELAELIRAHKLQAMAGLTEDSAQIVAALEELVRARAELAKLKVER